MRLKNRLNLDSRNATCARCGARAAKHCWVPLIGVVLECSKCGRLSSLNTHGPSADLIPTLLFCLAMGGLVAFPAQQMVASVVLASLCGYVASKKLGMLPLPKQSQVVSIDLINKLLSRRRDFIVFDLLMAAMFGAAGAYLIGRDWELSAQYCVAASLIFAITALAYIWGFKRAGEFFQKAKGFRA